MNAIINEFLILGRPQAEVFKNECCYSLLEEVLAVFEIQFETNGINIHYQKERGLTIHCDRNQIKQAFYNILKNTIEALPFGGEVKITVDVVNAYQRIRFADDGIGMTDEGLQRIGEPFYSTRPDGNGLGMMMVNKIVASHQGWLTISSEVGVGTTVEVFLPGS
ncbi:Sporulation kinase E [compost metagenome]